MAMNGVAAINFARRVIDKHSLTPPINIVQLVEKFATVEFRTFPISGIDGVSLFLKREGKRPLVVVEKNSYDRRIRFTLAHELGHIIIPWHTGNIVDQVEPQSTGDWMEYLILESEANAFAAELLVPQKWLTSWLTDDYPLAAAHERIIEECDVSIPCAALRLISACPPDTIFAIVRDDIFELSQRSTGTVAGKPVSGSQFDNIYEKMDMIHHESIMHAGPASTYWWRLRSQLSITTDDPRDWREIQSSIIDSIHIPLDEIERYKTSLNGVLSHAHGEAKRNLDAYSVERVVAVCIQRLQRRDDFTSLVNHPDFQSFILRRAQSFVEKSPRIR